jgi:lipopolysaccharide/colanic/teichoic acid biosynthesis glycosyltransferase
VDEALKDKIMEQTTEAFMDDTGADRSDTSVATAVLTVRTVEEISVQEDIIFHESSTLFHFFKRLMDIVISLLGIIVLVPVFIVVAVCIKLDDGGAIFHFREIVGLHNRRFHALKFRTMIPDADTYLVNHPELLQEYKQNMKLEYDPRVTRIGGFLRKTSLDELPQLFNVLIGQMTLVGPRMIHPTELPRYGKYAQKRLSVKPGITGLWQLYGRKQDSLETRITLDMQYIDSRSIYLDLVILLKTLKVFVIQTGC